MATEKQQNKISKVMREFYAGKLTTHGNKVTDVSQAKAIALSEAGVSKKKKGAALRAKMKYVKGGSMVETVLWATRKGEPDWAEELITDNPEQIEDAKKWALANGFDRIRVSKIDLFEKPDFEKALNKKSSAKKKMAKGGVVEFYNKDNEHRLGRPSGSIEKELLDKVDYDSIKQDFVGSFGWKTIYNKLGDGYLFNLDDYDQDLIKNIALRPTERIYRYINRTTAIGGMSPLIKINIEKGLLYFPIDNEADDILFETRGIKALWINLIEDKYAEGGSVDSEGIDLFEDYDNIPEKVQKVLTKYAEAFEEGDYDGLKKASKAVEKVGYTFEYGLDGIAYDLRPIGTKGKSEIEEFAKGGKATSIPKSVIDKINEINSLIKWAEDKDNFVGGYFGGTYYEYLDFEKPIEIKNQFVYIEYNHGGGYTSFDRYNVNKKGEFDSNGLVELKSELSRILTAFRRAKKKYEMKGYFGHGGNIEKENKEMIASQVKEAKHHSEELSEILKEDKDIEAWVVAKMERATTDLSDVTHYLDGKDEKYATGGGVGSSDTPKVWVGEWSLYNEGKLIGEWIDLSEYSSGEEVMDKIQELLDKWTKETGELREEYAVFDYENFPSSLYSEQMGEDSFDKVINAWEVSQERDIPMDVIGTIISEYDPNNIERWIEERFRGQYDSDTDFAYDWVDMMGGIENVSKNDLESYFDYESFGRDLVINNYKDIDGYYFDNYEKGGKIPTYDLKKYMKSGSQDCGCDEGGVYHNPFLKSIFGI